MKKIAYLWRVFARFLRVFLLKEFPIEYLEDKKDYGDEPKPPRCWRYGNIWSDKCEFKTSFFDVINKD